MAEGGSLLPMPVQEVQMKVFQGGSLPPPPSGGGTSSLLDMPETTVPMQVFKGGASTPPNETSDFSIDSVLSNSNITFRGLTLQELIEALYSVNKKKSLPILVLKGAKEGILTPLTQTQVTVNNIPFTITTGSMKMEGNKMKFLGKETLDLEKTYFYDSSDGIELKGGSFLSQNPLNSSNGENILPLVYREKAPFPDYKNDLFEEEAGIATVEESKEESKEEEKEKEQKDVVPLEEKVINSPQRKEKLEAIQKIKEKILKSKRNDSEVLSRLFQEKMGGEREAVLVSMYLLRQDSMHIDKDIEELLDFLEFVKEPVSFVSFNGKKGNFPPSTPLFQKVLQWDLQRKTQTLLEKLLGKKGVKNIPVNVKEDTNESPLLHGKESPLLHGKESSLLHGKEEGTSPLTPESSNQEEQKVILQDKTKIMEEIQSQGLGKETANKTGGDLYTLLSTKVEKFEARKKEAAKNRILGRQPEFIKVPKNLTDFFNSLDIKTINNLYYAYEKDFVQVPFEEIKLDSIFQEVFTKNIEEASTIARWYDENPLFILFWKVYLNWSKKTYEGSAVEDDWKYIELNNFIANLLLLTNKFKDEVSQFITPKSFENPLQTNSDFTVDKKLNLSIESFSIDELFYRLFHIEFNTQVIEKVLNGDENWILIGWIDTPGKTEFEKIQYKGCKENLQTLYDIFSKNEDAKKQYIDYTNRLFKEPINNTSARAPVVAWANQQPVTKPQKKVGRPTKGSPPASRTQSAKGGSRRMKKHITKTRRLTKVRLSIDGVRGRARKSRKARL